MIEQNGKYYHVMLTINAQTTAVYTSRSPAQNREPSIPQLSPSLHRPHPTPIEAYLTACGRYNSTPMSSFSSTTDPLSLFRIAIAQGPLPVLANSPSLKDVVTDIGTAKYIIFLPPSTESSAQPKPFPLNFQTRFISQDPSSAGPVDLRTVYHAWVNKDLTIAQYQASARALGEGKVKNLIFLERVDLFSWLEGQDSQFIQPSASDAGTGASMPSGPATGSGAVVDRTVGSTGRDIVIEPRLLEIYAQERPIGNRNTILRGEKPTVSF